MLCRALRRCRLRVRDINDAIKELGHMISMHMSTNQSLTKLSILQEAVNVITSLERQSQRGDSKHVGTHACVAREPHSCMLVLECIAVLAFQ